jgi:hypothetical protein
MELLLWLWLFDNRWIWGLPYPNKTAKLWYETYINLKTRVITLQILI